MTLKELKERIANTEDEQEIDELCLKWLKKTSQDYGRDGKIAWELLDIVRRLLCI